MNASDPLTLEDSNGGYFGFSSPASMRRRIASERFGRSVCFLRQSSTRFMSVAGATSCTRKSLVFPIGGKIGGAADCVKHLTYTPLIVCKFVNAHNTRKDARP
jgi:hypothetical protein